jgi:hypothetical protein
VDLRAAELAFGLPFRPREVDVAVLADVFHLDEHGVAGVPVEALESAVEFAPVEQPGDPGREVDEHAEVGESVDRPLVVSARDQLVRARTAEIEPDVFFVGDPIH